MKKEHQPGELDFKVLFESLPGLYLILSPELKIIEVSQAYLNATMASRQEIIGKYLFDAFPDNPNDSSATGVFNLRESLNYVLHNGAAHTMAIQKYDIRRPDGSFEERYWSPLNKPVLNEKNEVVYIIHRVEDMTEFMQLKKKEDHQVKVTEELSKKMKQAEVETYKRAQEIQDINKKITEKIEKEKDFSNSIINSLPGIFYLFDSNGKMIRWNKNFETVSEYSTDEVSKMHPIQFFDVDEQEYVGSRIKNVFINGVADAEAGFFTKSRNKVPHYFTGNLIMLDEGPCLIGMGVNIAEKMKAEAELKKSYQHIRALATHLQNIREEERGVIAREIHDELGQQLTGLKMDIAWLNRKLGKQSEEITEKFKSTLQLTDETVRTVRRIATELRPSILDDLGLIAAIEWQTAEFEKRFGIKTVFSTTINDLDLDPDITIGLFRIYQESLTNVLRHANAKKITSSLSIDKGILLFNIADNGKGFDINAVGDKKTLGLLGMKERSFIMGGEYAIKSKLGKGTTVTVTVPLQRDNHNHQQP